MAKATEEAPDEAVRRHVAAWVNATRPAAVRCRIVVDFADDGERDTIAVPLVPTDGDARKPLALPFVVPAWVEIRRQAARERRLERNERRRAKRANPPKCFVYFIRSGERVKIGIAEQPKRRLEGLQTGCPDVLELLCTIRGGRQKERELHARFAVHRVRENGEWFHYSDELREFIERLKAGSA